MAFTGTAVVKQISDNKVRITGVSLASGATGTIGLSGATGSAPDVHLPASFKTEHYTFDSVAVPFQDAILVHCNTAATPAEPLLISKAGSTVADFRISIANDGGSTSGGLEIVVTYH